MIQPIKFRPSSIARFGRKSALRVRGMSNVAHLRCSAFTPNLTNGECSPPQTSSAQRGFMASASRSANSYGFTIVELVLATAFIAFILIFMLATMTQVMGNYNKGLAVKQINQTARSVVEEMSRLVSSTKASSINTAYLNNGRVCIGGVSYVWNVKGATANKYTNGNALTMVRVNDAAGALCSSGLPAVDPAAASEQLSTGIWVQQINVTVSSNQKLVDITMSLSTASPNQPTGIDAVLGTICSGGKDSQYCAVATFKTTVSTNGGG